MTTTVTSTISRRAFQKLSLRNPSLTQKINLSPSKPKDESQWPRSLQILGYVAITCSIPYSCSVIITESKDVRSLLEERGGNAGQSMVKLVRHIRGYEEERPYYEYSESRKSENLFPGEDSNSTRTEQAEIHKRSKIRMNIRIIDESGLAETKFVVGGTPLSDSKAWSDNISKRLIISFDDDEEEEEEVETASSFESSSLQREDLKQLTNIWSTWHYFTKSSVGSDIKIDQTDIRIQELTYIITELQESLHDSDCARDRDDMTHELQQYQNELRGMKRDRFFGKLRKIFPF